MTAPAAASTSTAAPKTLSITTWNVNYDHRAAGKPEWAAFDWPARRSAVIDTILKFGSDIVCLQELRKENVTDILADRRLNEIYDMAYGRTNATDMAFCLLTMWNKKTWSCSDAATLWFGQDGMRDHWEPCPGGNGFGRIAFVTTLHKAVTPDPKGPAVTIDPHARSLRIFNVHFGLSEVERMHEAKLLRGAMMTMPETRAETFACGDFNSFPDARGAAEISEITRLSTYYEEAAPYGCPIDTISGCQVSGTQIAYPYDTYVKYKGTDHEEIHPQDGEMGGHLDHIFQPHAEGIIMNSCRLLTYMTNGEVARPDQLCFNKSDTAPRFPSDHMPMKAEFTLPVFQ